MIPGVLIFACGARIEANNIEKYPVGHSIKVYTSPHQGHRKPMFADGQVTPGEAICMSCPCKVRESGRHYQRGWHENGQYGCIVTCKVVRVEALQSAGYEADGL